jgi:6-phosphofructokinase 1
LATLSGLASGADQSYIYEEPFTIHDLFDDIQHLRKKMEGDLKRGILIRNEKANDHYTTEFLENLLCEEGKGVFTARSNVLGHMQQGGVPTPFDRNLGLKLASKSLAYMIRLLEGREAQAFHVDSAESAVVIGMQKKVSFLAMSFLVNLNF